jgi:outer membrane protein assembly factor BamA
LGVGTHRATLADLIFSLVLAAGSVCGAVAHAAVAAVPVAPAATETAASDDALDVTALPDTCPREHDGKIISQIRFHGMTLTRPFVVERALKNKVGQAFSCDKYRAEKAHIQSLDIFATMRIAVEPGAGGLRVTYRVLELPRYLFYPAVKRSDLYGWLAGPGASWLNFLGRDIRLEAFLRTAVHPDAFVATEMLIEASSPWIGRDIPIEYYFALVRIQSFNATKQFKESSWSGVLDLYHRLSWRLKLIYAAELYQVSADPSNPTFNLASNPAPVPIVLDPAGDLVPGLGFGLLWDSRDRWVNPHSGVWQELRVSKYGGVLGGPADYVHYLFDHRSWWSKRWNAAQLTILHLSALARLRPGTMGVYDYFTVGGPNSLRSYMQDSELVAQSEALLTAEVRHELFDRTAVSFFGFHVFYGLQIVAGADVALLWRAHDALDGEPRVHPAAYTGVHVLLPGVDRLRFEIFMQRDANGGLRPNFSIGLFEKAVTQRSRLR